MTDWSLPGRCEVALTHFALVGMSLIITETADTRARFWWSDELRPQAVLSNDNGLDAAAEAVHAHATRHTASSSWIHATLPSGPRAGAAVFTPRGGWPGSTKEPTVHDWTEYVQLRRAARSAASMTLLDESFLAALGEPAWWRSPGKDDRPDDGASRWEMKTRNKGSEIFKDRLLPLADAVSRRDLDGIRRGLCGDAVVDETGKNSSESRTSTGLTTPGPVDSALAWCALWGLSATRVVRRWTGDPGAGNFRGASATSGIADDSKQLVGANHPTRAALPVFTSPVGPHRWGDVLATRQFFETAFSADAGDDHDAVQRLASRAWLREQGVRALVRFPILKTGSASAPERQVLDGRIEAL